MKVLFSDRFTRNFARAPEQVQKALGKQLGHLLGNLQHPSLHAKKYDEARGIGQARVDQNWRFYFTIESDTFHMADIIPTRRNSRRVHQVFQPAMQKYLPQLTS